MLTAYRRPALLLAMALLTACAGADAGDEPSDASAKQPVAVSVASPCSDFLSLEQDEQERISDGLAAEIGAVNSVEPRVWRDDIALNCQSLGSVPVSEAIELQSAMNSTSNGEAGVDVAEPGADTGTDVDEPPSGLRELSFTFTDPEGWQYEGIIEVPELPVLSLTKDISSSPPGQARIVAALSDVFVAEEQTFNVVNPGRPDGPPLTISPGYFAFGFDQTLYEGQDQPPSPGGQCRFDGNSFYAFEPFKAQLTCNSGIDESGEDGSEAAVDRFIAGVSTTDPTYVLQFDQVMRYCAVYVQPDGTFSFGQDNTCTAPTLTWK